MDGIDLAAEGLLDGVAGPARAARERLLRELLDDGCSLDELRAAIAQDRLALVPTERLLRADERHRERYTAEQLAERAGVDPSAARTALAALGLPPAPAGVAGHTEIDAELTELLAVGLNAGVPVELIAELNRVIARGVSQMAAASRTAVIEATMQPGMTEREAALVWAQAARRLAPNTIRVIGLAYEAHLLRLVRSSYLGAEEIVAGRTPGARTVCIAFADLVGFTRLGQSVPAEDLGRVARRLDEAAASVIRPPVELVKTIGDAVMLATPDASAALDVLLDLVEATRSLGGGFPQLRAGVARGAALERAGDWYGDTVNLASRVTGAAPPDGVVATDAVREAVAGEPGAYRFTPIEAPPLKGIASPPALFRVERAGR